MNEFRVENTYPYRDWDYFTSMITSIRRYAFEHDTIPLWNFMICGGKPELANPQSWAFTWVSPLAYLLPPIAAILTIWILMSIVGWASMRSLLIKLGAEPRGSSWAATLYVLNGYFASHFNQGHVTFAFFHLLPLLANLALNLLTQHRSNRSYIAKFSSVVMVSFLFFTAGLPHALFYFFPMFILVILYYIFLILKQDTSKSLWRTVSPLAAALVTGILLSGYKLYPIIKWQIDNPRKGVVDESISLLEAITMNLRFSLNYDDPLALHFQNQFWFYWEYNAFLGWPVLVLVVITFLKWLQKSLQLRSIQPIPKLALLGAFSIALGLNLALGNNNIFSLSSLFSEVPLLSGIRVFPRFSILVIFGIVAIASVAIDLNIGEIRQQTYQRKLVAWLLPVVFVAPGIVQSIMLVLTVRTESAQEIASFYNLPATNEIPSLVKQERLGLLGHTDQTFLLERNVWLANCYEPMTTDRLPLGDKRLLPLTDPAPKQLLELSSAGMRLAYAPSENKHININLAAAANLAYSTTTSITSSGRLVAELAPTVDGSEMILEINHKKIVHDAMLGLGVSGLGVILLLVSLTILRSSTRSLGV